MAGRDPNCLFCDGIEPTRGLRLDADRLLWRSDGFYAMLDLNPVVEGHVNLCSHDHYPSAADLPPERADELDRVCAWFREVYDRAYGRFALFEHGRTGHCVRRSSGERMCEHLHVHLAPLADDFADSITLGQRVSSPTWTDVGVLGSDVDGYVVVETLRTPRTFFPVTTSLPPHYLRSRAAELVDAPDFADWEHMVDNRLGLDLVDRARSRLTAVIAELDRHSPT